MRCIRLLATAVSVGLPKAAAASCMLAFAATASMAVAGGATKTATLEEILVRATSLKPHELRRMIVEAEDQFYARYNEINAADEFDVNCIVYARTGTNLKHRSCRPVFEERAIQEHGREVFLIRQDVQNQIAGGVVKRAPGTPPPMPMDKIQVLRPAFRANMQRVVESDVELLRLLRLRDSLEQLRTGGE